MNHQRSLSLSSNDDTDFATRLKILSTASTPRQSFDQPNVNGPDEDEKHNESSNHSRKHSTQSTEYSEYTEELNDFDAHFNTVSNGERLSPISPFDENEYRQMLDSILSEDEKSSPQQKQINESELKISIESPSLVSNSPFVSQHSNKLINSNNSTTPNHSASANTAKNSQTQNFTEPNIKTRNQLPKINRTSTFKLDEDDAFVANYPPSSSAEQNVAKINKSLSIDARISNSSTSASSNHSLLNELAMIALIQQSVSQPDPIDLDLLLVQCEESRFYHVQTHIYENYKRDTKNSILSYVKCISQMRLHDPKQAQLDKEALFGYLHRLLRQTKRTPEFGSVVHVVLQHLQVLQEIDLGATVTLLLSHFSPRDVDLQVALLCAPRLEFAYLRRLIESTPNLSSNPADLDLNDAGESIHKRFLPLLCQFAPSTVLDYLLENLVHHTVDVALRIVLQHRIDEAAIYLYERKKEYDKAIELSLSMLDNKLMDFFHERSNNAFNIIQDDLSSAASEFEKWSRDWLIECCALCRRSNQPDLFIRVLNILLHYLKKFCSDADDTANGKSQSAEINASLAHQFRHLLSTFLTYASMNVDSEALVTPLTQSVASNPCLDSHMRKVFIDYFNSQRQQLDLLNLLLGCSNESKLRCHHNLLSQRKAAIFCPSKLNIPTNSENVKISLFQCGHCALTDDLEVNENLTTCQQCRNYKPLPQEINENFKIMIPKFKRNKDINHQSNIRHQSTRKHATSSSLPAPIPIRHIARLPQPKIKRHYDSTSLNKKFSSKQNYHFDY